MKLKSTVAICILFLYCSIHCMNFLNIICKLNMLRFASRVSRAFASAKENPF